MNANTIVNALRGIGPVTLKNATVLTLFEYTPSAEQAVDNPGTLLPVVLGVPSQASLDYNASGSSGSGAGNTAVSPLDGSSLSSGGLWTADGRAFKIRASGTVVPLSSGKSLTLALFVGNGNVGGQANDVAIANVVQVLSAAPPIASNWLLEVTCLWDRTSSRLNTVLSGQINGVAVAAEAYSIPNIAEGQLNFCLGALMNDSGAGHADTFNITLNEFCADQV